MAAIRVKVGVIEPALECGVASGRFRIEHGDPHGISVAPLHDHVLAENSFQGKAQLCLGPGMLANYTGLKRVAQSDD